MDDQTKRSRGRARKDFRYVPLRPVRVDDGRAAPERTAGVHAAAHTVSAAEHPYFARMQRVCANPEGRRTKIVRRDGPGTVLQNHNVTVPDTYSARIAKDNDVTWLGTFDTYEEADLTLRMYVDTCLEPTDHEIVEEFVEAICAEFSAAERRAFASMDGPDPISDAAMRLGVPMTLHQIGRLQGVTRERIRQIEAWILKRIEASGALRDYEISDRASHWDAMELMG